MKKLFFILLSVVFLFASSKYEDAISEGKGANKRVIFMVSTKGCPWCKKMRQDILPLPEIQVKLNNFVFVEIDKNKDSYPNTIETTMVPSFFTIDPKNGELLSERAGFQNKTNFMIFLNESGE